MKKNKSHHSTFVVLLLAALVPGFTMLQQAKTVLQPKPAATVEMTNTLTFAPDTVRIKTGQTVLWKNTSDLVHSVTCDPSLATIKGSAHLPKGARAFNSGMLNPDQTFSHTFKVPGIYNYFCIPHEAVKMRGAVIVTQK